ncbi:MAG: signal peptidase I [Gammaproteobacteria bacterium]|nr:signal peptidase I [Gammaproteobacteria bacterium]MCP4880050.1 signal peptidase I [Gammaproteobacteria bacterium]
MDFDFELVLVVGCALSGIGWAVEAWWWKPARLRRLNDSVVAAGGQLPNDSQLALLKEPAIAEYSRSFFPVLALVLVLRSFLFEPYQIPSGSMLPTLQVGDFIVVNKYTYGLRLPVMGTKIMRVNAPQRGDVMVFKFPHDTDIKYIKRVVGIPGDSVTYVNKQILINDRPIPQEYVGMDISGNEIMREALGDTNHLMWKRPGDGQNWRTEVIPEGHYFMLGDNRDGSNDSRYWGLVKEELIVGKAVAVWMQWKKLFSLPSFSTVGSIE